MANWSELHHDLLVEIAGQIKLYEDFVSFRWVCTSWRWAAAIKKFMYKFNQMPLLMHMPLNCGDINQRGFFSLSRGMSRRILLPEANSHRNCLSSKGWLLRLHVQNLNASLLNPFHGFNLNFRTYVRLCPGNIASTIPSSSKNLLFLRVIWSDTLIIR